jgi:hypothetical protein
MTNQGNIPTDTTEHASPEAHKKSSAALLFLLIFVASLISGLIGFSVAQQFNQKPTAKILLVERSALIAEFALLATRADSGFLQTALPEAINDFYRLKAAEGYVVLDTYKDGNGLYSVDQIPGDAKNITADLREHINRTIATKRQQKEGSK